MQSMQQRLCKEWHAGQEKLSSNKFCKFAVFAFTLPGEFQRHCEIILETEKFEVLWFHQFKNFAVTVVDLWMPSHHQSTGLLITN